MHIREASSLFVNFKVYFVYSFLPFIQLFKLFMFLLKECKILSRKDKYFTVKTEFIFKGAMKNPKTSQFFFSCIFILTRSFRRESKFFRKNCQYIFQLQQKGIMLHFILYFDFSMIYKLFNFFSQISYAKNKNSL